MGETIKNKLQLNLEVPHRQTAGSDTQPPKTDTRRAYICELYKTFGWTPPPEWSCKATPKPEFSEPEVAVGEPEQKKVKRIRVIK